MYQMESKANDKKMKEYLTKYGVRYDELIRINRIELLINQCDRLTNSNVDLKCINEAITSII